MVKWLGELGHLEVLGSIPATTELFSFELIFPKNLFDDSALRKRMEDQNVLSYDALIGLNNYILRTKTTILDLKYRLA